MKIPQTQPSAVCEERTQPSQACQIVNDLKSCLDFFLGKLILNSILSEVVSVPFDANCFTPSGVYICFLAGIAL